MSFTLRVYQLIRRIPKGKVMTYGQIAKALNHPHAARAVGLAMKLNPDAPATPCHRVVASTGNLHGYSAPGGLTTKAQMLRTEGVHFVGNKVDLTRSLWQPS